MSIRNRACPDCPPRPATMPARLLLAALIGIAPWAAPNAAAAPSPGSSADADADARLRVRLDKEWQHDLDRDPTLRTRLGIRGPAEGWTPTTDERDAEDEARARRKLRELHASFAAADLSEQGRLEYRIYELALRTRIRQVEYRRNGYFFTRNTSDPYLDLPQLLISSQAVGSVDDAREYLARLRGSVRLLQEAEAGTRERARRGIVLPAFNFPDIAANSRAFVRGRPCDEGPADHAVWRDFQDKLERIALSERESARLLEQGRAALRDEVCPAYRRFADVFERMGRDVAGNDGLWSLENGDELYRDAIELHTSMRVDPGELHRTGLEEVARTEAAIRAFMERDGFRGTVGEYFAMLRADPRHLLPQSPEGRAAYLAAAQEVLDRAALRLPELFSRIPRRPLVVRAVEPEREASLGTQAFYSAPPGDGPGIFYAGLADMSRLPLWEIEPIAYHEGLPGHHFQVSLAEEATGRSEYRRRYRNAAYQEGWGLYAEGLGAELGGYRDDLSRLARHRLDLLRAVRIVVDTGFHHERWSWEQCAAYLSEHLGLPLQAARQEATRYMVWPGQGVSYKLGELEIRRLRAKAESALGAAFDVRDFHAILLDDGVLPFDILAEKVDRWIDAATRDREQDGR